MDDLAHLADNAEELMDLSDDELSVVLSEIMREIEGETVTEDMILEITDLAEEEWYEKGEKLSNVPHLREVAARRFEAELNLG